MTGILIFTIFKPYFLNKLYRPKTKPNKVKIIYGIYYKLFYINSIDINYKKNSI